MTTGSEFVRIVDKRLMGADDFGTRLVTYVREMLREALAHVWDVDGVLAASKWAMAGSGADEFTIAPVTPFYAVDGQGRLLYMPDSGGDENVGNNLTFAIANGLGVKYYISLQYTEVPYDIVINPRNGLPNFRGTKEAIGVSGAPNSVVDNGTTLTMVIDAVCEAAHSHAGRKALVYKATPGRGATTAAVAIEVCTVAWDGSNNSITTTAQFGQDDASTEVSDYVVTLLGPSVRLADTENTAGHVHLGFIDGVGAGNTPGAGDTTGQKLVDASLTDILTYNGGPNWIDGITNPSTTFESQLDKIITDLSGTAGGDNGAAKIGLPILTTWLDGSFEAGGSVYAAFGQIINALKAVASGNHGAAKIGSYDLSSQFADATVVSAGSIHAVMSAIVSNLASTAAQDGAGRIGAKATGNFLVGSVRSQLDAIDARIVSDEWTYPSAKSKIVWVSPFDGHVSSRTSAGAETAPQWSYIDTGTPHFYVESCLNDGELLIDLTKHLRSDMTLTAVEALVLPGDTSASLFAQLYYSTFPVGAATTVGAATVASDTASGSATAQYLSFTGLSIAIARVTSMIALRLQAGNSGGTARDRLYGIRLTFDDISPRNG